MKHFTVTLTKGEMLGGWIYLAVQLLILPDLLKLVNAFLAYPWDNLQLNLIYYVINLLSILLIFHRFLWKSLKQLLKSPGKILGTAVLGCLVYWFANFIVSIAIFILMPDFSNSNDSNIAGMAQTNFWLIALSTVILVPIAEEALYRGLLFGCLYQKAPLAGYLLSTAAFCAIHVIGYIDLYPWDTLLISFVTYIPAGLCLSWGYARSDCFFTPVIMHTLINAVSILSLR